MKTDSALILQVAARFLLPMLLLFSIFLLLRGHNEPGGGFIAGLVASSAFALHLFAFTPVQTRQLMGVDGAQLMGAGLLTAVLSGIIGVIQSGSAFLTSVWWSVYLPGVGELKLSTPLLFDIGVYLVVIGMVTTLLLTLAEVEE
ncbi:Na+/H+ antiporter subunit B [Vibrio cincinnatiensis]|jgi:multicomponent Na+:H+ antiporter subunit B|uniref:Multicomponent Na+:H+ antiporter subunit B n=1 Tax=Vibrio cincinnatiensis DSM 19608 TaxID=1123491 RepID=A0A1T4M1A5_VIBCI|nr:Na+/H+ antiporter subunit B [Vibrio cincinnatiensis]MCG3723559.1 Na+/H+ antiporter subunit B [Vibrio cincinnatiensis]MCG3726638.1 Na+/H+ antiporter subunit B [Vibrio cincinnatiensis]MCG3733276.1 Na+/H+ antiporter subunit B [Vibrio cincinnatiensis]MCG3735422.1 Na+/H+ antiporter subunit B [Vibrio cincinnatiensis]MCG3740178.1 Na+/H+ antiporter subunit B [Vibrio cincinnatiensis]